MDIELQVGLTSEQVDAIEQLARASRSARAVGMRPAKVFLAALQTRHPPYVEFEVLELRNRERDNFPPLAALIGEGAAAKADAMFFGEAKACMLALISDWRRLTDYVARLEAEVEDKRAIRDAANSLAATILRCAPQLADGQGLVPVEACRVAAEYVRATRGHTNTEGNMDDRSSMLGRDHQ